MNSTTVNLIIASVTIRLIFQNSYVGPCGIGTNIDILQSPFLRILFNLVEIDDSHCGPHSTKHFTIDTNGTE